MSPSASGQVHTETIGRQISKAKAKVLRSEAGVTCGRGREGPAFLQIGEAVGPFAL